MQGPLRHVACMFVADNHRRFLESLSAKVHPTPLGIDALSQLFQDFYERAQTHIATHIATLSSRLSRNRPLASAASARSGRVGTRSGAGTPLRKDAAPEVAGDDQPLMSASEIMDKRRARKLLELKRVALEEAVERAVCEKLYAKLYRHRSTDDEERDQKLRSRVAALHLVGIGFKELLAGTSEELTPEMKQKVAEEEDQVKEWLEPARASLIQMDDEHCPAGKLKLLTAAHKAIVETLAKLFPSSSSADEVLPTLIYALITTPPSDISVISHLDFIQRFRAASKVDGEAAYCMVNLEAAISFLETVDLSSLRKGERPQGPDKNSRPSTPRAEAAPMQLGIAPASDLAGASDSDSGKPAVNKPNSRRLSQLTNPFQGGAARFEAASENLREAMLDGADQAFDAINNTLENSFKFMFGRLKEQQVKRSASNASKSSRRVASGGQAAMQTKADDAIVEMPKTLEDARKLVAPTTDELFDDATSLSIKSDVPDDASDNGVTPPMRVDSGSKLMDLVGGRRQMRERSADSSRSGGSASGKKVAFMDGGKDPLSTRADIAPLTLGGLPAANAAAATGPPPPSSPGNQAVESLRGLGNSLNPFNRMPGMSGFFGRAQSATPGISTPVAEKERALQAIPNDVETVPVPLTPKEARALTGIEELKKLVAAGNTSHSPTMKKFEAIKDVRELKIAEVEELLRAYQSLVGSVRSVVDS